MKYFSFLLSEAKNSLDSKAIHEHDMVSKCPVDVQVNLFDLRWAQPGLLLHFLSEKQTKVNKDMWRYLCWKTNVSFSRATKTSFTYQGIYIVNSVRMNLLLIMLTVYVCHQFSETSRLSEKMWLHLWMCWKCDYRLVDHLILYKYVSVKISLPGDKTVSFDIS